MTLVIVRILDARRRKKGKMSFGVTYETDMGEILSEKNWLKPYNKIEVFLMIIL